VCFGFWKAKDEAHPFVSTLQLILMESQNKPKQTPPYMDPVYLQTGRLTEKSNVYSFGVVILEVISRKKATHKDNNSLMASFLECHKEGKKGTELFDQEIVAAEDLELLDAMARIAVDCLNIDVDQRPSMTDVVARLVALNTSRVS
jgi:hypothetical protein